MAIAGIMKVWNEIEIIEDSLDHLAGLADFTVVYDDASDDGTADVVRNHPGVDIHILGTERYPSRPAAQGGTLQVLLEAAQIYEPEWIMHLDADERIEGWPANYDEYDGVRMKLFDFYITEEDVHWPYTQRRWIGPEYREILMAYRAFPGMSYGWRDQREMWGLPGHYRVLNSGYVRHYGKAISVERWERQCEYYATTFPEPYKTKWENRRGKAIHSDKSDFGAELILWSSKDHHGERI